MTVYKIYPDGFASNSYLVTADGKRAIAIDPAQPHILAAAQKRGLKVEAVLLTHGHFDHIAGCGALFGAGAKIGCHENEVSLVLGEDNLASTMGGGMEIEPFEIGFTVTDGQEIELCGIPVRVIATPGHTAGGVCYLIGDTLFTGDTLFECGYGRYDLPTGNRLMLEKSMLKLFELDGDYVLRTGHGGDSTLENERKYNGYRL